jgi:hypothetical protein
MAFRPVFRKTLAFALAAAMVAAAMPAQAQPYPSRRGYGPPPPPPRYYDRGDAAGAAALGLLGGVALGAAIAGSQQPAPRQCWTERRKVWIDGHREWEEVEVCR